MKEITPMWAQLIHPGAVLPNKLHEGDAGYDLSCCQNTIVSAWQVKLVPLGIRVHLPEGYYARIVGRSSSLRNGLFIHESVIDNGFRGELFVVASGWGCEVEISQGQRIAQLILLPLEQASIKPCDEVSYASSDGRGANGFGSTGGWRK